MLGLEKVPCIIADDLTPEQIKAFRLVDNKVGELAGWDFAKLEEELVSIADKFDMNAFGFTSEDMGDIDFSIGGEADQGDLTQKDKKEICCPNCGELIEV